MIGAFPSGRASALLSAVVLSLALVTATLVTAGCGFRPMMGDMGGETMAERLDQVDIANLGDRAGQQLRNLLIDRFYRDGRPAATIYRLEITLINVSSPMGLQKDALASRGQWDIVTNFRLMHIATGKVVFQASSRAMPGFSYLNSQYASMVSETGALDRGLVQVADDIRSRVAMFLARPEDQRPPLP